jgi:hypothetical protein
MRVIAVVLIALGLVGLIYGGVSWTRRESVADIGPVHVTREREKSLPVPPLAGGLCLVAGVVLLLRGGGRTA